MRLAVRLRVVDMLMRINSNTNPDVPKEPRCLAIIATLATGFQATGFHWVSFIRLNIRAYRCCVQA